MWTIENISQKSATWVFSRTGPFIFTWENFPRKWWILRYFWDPLNTIFAVAADKEMGLSRNSLAKLNLDFIFLSFVYLSKMEFDCKWGCSTERFLFQIKTELPRITLGTFMRIEGFLFHYWREQTKSSAEQNKICFMFWNVSDWGVVDSLGKARQDCCLIFLWLKALCCQQLQSI